MTATSDAAASRCAPRRRAAGRSADVRGQRAHRALGVRVGIRRPGQEPGSIPFSGTSRTVGWRTSAAGAAAGAAAVARLRPALTPEWRRCRSPRQARPRMSPPRRAVPAPGAGRPAWRDHGGRQVSAGRSMGTGHRAASHPGPPRDRRSACRTSAVWTLLRRESGHVVVTLRYRTRQFTHAYRASHVPLWPCRGVIVSCASSQAWRRVLSWPSRSPPARSTVAVDHLESNVTRIDISDQVGERPVDYGDLSSGPVTFLLMGSDQRTGKGNKGYGFFEGARSDTTMLVHVYPDRDSAVVVSIPRDTVVDLPTCKDADGATVPGTRDRFNTAFDMRWPGLHREDRRGDDRPDRRPLRRAGLQRLQADDRRPRRRRGLPDPTAEGHQVRCGPAGRAHPRQRRGRARIRPRAAQHRRRLGHQPDQPPAAVPVLADPGGDRLGPARDPVRVWRVLDESSKSIATDPALADCEGAQLAWR